MFFVCLGGWMHKLQKEAIADLFISLVHVTLYIISSASY